MKKEIVKIISEEKYKDLCSRYEVKGYLHLCNKLRTDPLYGFTLVQQQEKAYHYNLALIKDDKDDKGKYTHKIQFIYELVEGSNEESISEIKEDSDITIYHPKWLEARKNVVEAQMQLALAKKALYETELAYLKDVSKAYEIIEKDNQINLL